MPLIRHATEADLPAILAIYNDAVENTTAIWNERLVDLEDRRAWLKARTEAGFPVLIAEHDGRTIGYASYGAFRAFDGYRHTAELSLYVDEAARGGGVGRLLLTELIDEAKRRGVHVLIAGIEAGNAASIGLHAALGFKETGRMAEVGRKFNRWLDLVLMQRIL
ncbi:N-acetyltransferase [Phyllobacterium salinisoli]|uniref:N-acetyltransferase n=1 Tax=Phyllobacterium salinisoli TaxID=1899321 RepID=A0A368K5L1_9HYPH|nr:GNAT family N-acetyltransferase [Phyllobacterium salinisoli]RCS23763.1 N-acetyltransferase [Phyllobacterium salinisoli]